MRNFFSFILLLLICIFSIRELNAWSYPLVVDVTEITFDWTSGYSNDALDIKKNRSTDILKPEYTSSRNNPFAYIKNQTNRQIKAKFYHNQGYGDVCNLHLEAHPWGSGHFGYINETFVSFSGCGPTSALTTLTASGGSVPGAVNKNSFEWDWYCTKVNGTSVYDIYLCATPHTYYILLAAAKSPNTEPRTDILNYACNWASGATNSNNAGDKILDNGTFHGVGSCHSNSSDFCHYVSSIGGNVSINFWGAKNSDYYHGGTLQNGDMLSFYTKATYLNKHYNHHYWAQTWEGTTTLQRDPSFMEAWPGNWGEWETELIDRYKIFTSGEQINQPGQTIGCEHPTRRVYDDGPIRSYTGP